MSLIGKLGRFEFRFRIGQEIPFQFLARQTPP
jgi:hypothetical protein